MRQRLEHVMARIRGAAARAGRGPESVRLVAVSKTMEAQTVEQAIRAGAATFGENFIQESRAKIGALSAYPVSWHFIGHLQTNKAKYAVKLFELIHSLDSYKLAVELDRRAKGIGKRQEVLVQVNISEESSKSGVSALDAIALVRDVSRLGNLSVRGLMTMPPFFDDPERARPYYSALRDLGDQIRQEAIENVAMEELSMGMTGDFEIAIEEGATLVRIGTAIFGRRQ